jgi:hypothetical protein
MRKICLMVSKFKEKKKCRQPGNPVRNFAEKHFSPANFGNIPTFARKKRKYV